MDSTPLRRGIVGGILPQRGGVLVENFPRGDFSNTFKFNNTIVNSRRGMGFSQGSFLHGVIFRRGISFLLR